MRLTLLILAILISGCDHRQLLEIRGNTMGTTYSVKVVDSPIGEKELKAELETELQRINQLMSTYIGDSELSRLNRAEVNQWIALSVDTLRVIELGLELSRFSNGSFDVTVGPLVNLWGFGPGSGAGDKDKVPSEASIREAMGRVGYQFIKIQGKTLKKEKPVYIDLSAIAKGYGVDRLVEILEKHHSTNYLAEIGGELRGRGRNERGTHWNIAIERPDSSERAPFTTLAIDNYAVATSGDYRNYFEINGTRYSHTIDPEIGKPISHNLASVSVLAETAVLADGWATTLNVLGPDRGLALAEAQNIAALFIIKESGGFREISSTRFLQLISNTGSGHD